MPDKLIANKWTVVLLIAAMVPSAVLTWIYRDVPHFGQYHDETMYYASGKSLAEGRGYRIQSLPGEPLQTKYPPLYCAVLSLAWRIEPAFPANLSVAAGLLWLILPAYLAAAFLLMRRVFGFGERASAALAAALALNAYVILFTLTLLSEQFFTCFLLLAVLLIERAARSGASPAWAFGAGIAGGAALLVRGAGLPLLAAGCVTFLLKRDFRRAGLFVCGMLPAAAGWMTWSAANQSQATDLLTLYYTGYSKFQALSVPFSVLHLVAWKNAATFLTSAGSLFLPDIVPFEFHKILCMSLGVLAIRGVCRLFTGAGARAYIAYALLSSLILIVWHMPPTERFLLPLFPLLLAGLVRQVESLWPAIRAGFRHHEKSQRMAARLLAGAAMALAIFAIALQLLAAYGLLPASMREARGRLHRNQAAYAYIRETLPPDAVLLADDDGLLFFHTQRKALRLNMLTTYWYSGDDRPVRQAYQSIVDYGRRFGATHAFFTQDDFGRQFDDNQQKIIRNIIETHPDLEVAARFNGAALYAIKPSR